MWTDALPDTPRLQYLEVEPETPWVEIGYLLRDLQDEKPINDRNNLLAALDPISLAIESARYGCNSKPIYAFLQSPNANLCFGSNAMLKPNPTCYRHVNRLDEYDTCYRHCSQFAHAEEALLVNYLASTNQMEALAQVCGTATFNQNGDLVLGTFNYDAAYNLDIKFPAGTVLNLWGVKGCCDRCACLMQKLGVTQVYFEPNTQQANYTRRREIHGF